MRDKVNIKTSSMFKELVNGAKNPKKKKKKTKKNNKRAGACLSSKRNIKVI